MKETKDTLSERVTVELGRSTIELKDYIYLLHNEGNFIIPEYQRGYIWGQRKKDEPNDSATHLISTLKESYVNCKNVFLQGITVHGKDNSNDIVLVDGQQRTTFFYLLLKYLGYDGHIGLKYDIRQQSNEYLQNIDLTSIEKNEDEEFQDIFFFKRTLRIFKRVLEGIDKKSFESFILNHVRFLLVIIPEDQAKIVFSMMNGNKAKMTEEELIKAELLRCASLKHDIISEAEHAEVRSRLAREWDYWLRWWNNKEVKDFFRTEGRQLGWLLPIIANNNKVSFKDFKEKLLTPQSMKQSKAVFKKMRMLQKSIEDIYYNSRTYNYFGLILYLRNSSSQRFAFFRWFFNLSSEKAETRTKSESELKRYYDWTIIGVNHDDIVSNNIAAYNDERIEFLNTLSSNNLFIENYEVAFRWLLSQNIKQDNKHEGRRFDFNIERNRSIEHIYPKSKIGHLSDSGKKLDYNGEELDEKHLEKIQLWREEMRWVCPEDKVEHSGSEHCIGNLVLLYKRDNSMFNDADFQEKNLLFFTVNDNDDAFKSRHLIHTTMVFSDVRWNDWNKEQIPRQKFEAIKEFKNEYPELNTLSNE